MAHGGAVQRRLGRDRRPHACRDPVDVHILGFFERGCSAWTYADGLARNLAADCVPDDVYELGDHGYEPGSAMGLQLSRIQPRGMVSDCRPGGTTSDNRVGRWRDRPGLAT